MVKNHEYLGPTFWFPLKFRQSKILSMPSSRMLSQKILSMLSKRLLLQKILSMLKVPFKKKKKNLGQKSWVSRTNFLNLQDVNFQKLWSKKARVTRTNFLSLQDVNIQKTWVKNHKCPSFDSPINWTCFYSKVYILKIVNSQGKIEIIKLFFKMFKFLQRHNYCFNW